LVETLGVDSIIFNETIKLPNLIKIKSKAEESENERLALAFSINYRPDITVKV